MTFMLDHRSPDVRHIGGIRSGPRRRRSREEGDESAPLRPHQRPRGNDNDVQDTTEAFQLTDEEIKQVQEQFERMNKSIKIHNVNFEELVEEYERFLQIKIAGLPVVTSFLPPVLIDLCWQAHIVCTRSYEAYCQRYNHGKMLHYVPPPPPEDTASAQQRYHLTLEGYTNLFGARPTNPIIWPENPLVLEVPKAVSTVISVVPKSSPIKEEFEEKIPEDEVIAIEEDTIKPDTVSSSKMACQVIKDGHSFEWEPRSSQRDLDDNRNMLTESMERSQSHNTSEDGSPSSTVDPSKQPRMSHQDSSARRQLLLDAAEGMHSDHSNLGPPKIGPGPFGNHVGPGPFGNKHSPTNSRQQSLPYSTTPRETDPDSRTRRRSEEITDAYVRLEFRAGNHLKRDEMEDVKAFLRKYGRSRGTTEGALIKWHKMHALNPDYPKRRRLKCRSGHSWSDGDFDLTCPHCRQSSFRVYGK